MSHSSLVWFRIDLRLSDNPALDAARAIGGGVVPLFIWNSEEEAPWAPGGASRWWLHQSLKALDESLRKVGSRLILREGSTVSVLAAVAKEVGAKAVFWNRRYEPGLIIRDSGVKDALRQRGLDAESFNAALLHEPWTIRNQSGKPFQVFTPYWKHCLAKPDPGAPLPPPSQLAAPPKWPSSIPLESLQLEPKINWTQGLTTAWKPGEVGALGQLRAFLSDALFCYQEDRNRPGLVGTSRLSPHLHFGEIGPRQIWHALKEHALITGPARKAWQGSQFFTELGWREFAHHLLYHFPQTPTEPLRREFSSFPWRQNKVFLKAWERGQTGYPIVDAGMRELWTTGWMHNRVRMIVASFLVKDLLISWQEGARWFWDTLVDADLAQNIFGWQWTAGCGADAAPYFRVFNPVTQGKTFDPHGTYVQKWCPELAKLPDQWVHHPWDAPSTVLQQAGVVLDHHYPKPLLSHSIAREVALEAFNRIKEARALDKC